LLCNVYLHRLDRAWDVREHGVLVRYADDALVLCKSRQQAEAALARLRVLLADLGLEPKQAKTRIVHLQVGGEGCDFLGFEHRLVRHAPRRGGKPITYLARWPTNKAMQHARDRIRELTDRSRLWLHVGEIVGDLNRFLHAWATYLQVRQLDPALRQGQTLCAHAAGVVYQQTPSSQPRVWLVGGGSRLTRPTGSGRPDRDRRRSQTLPGLAGEAESRR
jgi:Reverse transcriptase (RNA-dependent DNA polymerase)